jgi:hypothetical protein
VPNSTGRKGAKRYAFGVTKVIARLRELVAALDRRAPRPERENEDEIARDAAALKREALERIADFS